METKFSKRVSVSVGRANDPNGTVDVDTFLWFPEIFMELVDSPGQCVSLDADQAEELGEALIAAAQFRREVERS